MSTGNKFFGYFIRGLANYNRGYFSEALQDLAKIVDKTTDEKQKAFKYNLIGSTYFALGSLYEKESEKAYRKSIKYNSELASAYYNLAVLYNRQKNNDKTNEMLDGSLAIDGNFAVAKEAKDKLAKSSGSDWFDWWFASGKGKMAIGVILIAAVVAPFAIFGIMIDELYIAANDMKDLRLFISQNVAQLIAGLTVTIGIVVGILLLPSLQSFKVGSAIELETIRMNTESTNLVMPMKADIPVIQADMSLQNPLSLSL